MRRAFKQATGETLLKRDIKHILRRLGWFVRHNLQGLGCYAGMPDITATKAGVTVEIEAKMPNGKQGPRQADYQRDLEAAGGTYLLIKHIDELIQWLKENGEERIW